MNKKPKMVIHKKKNLPQSLPPISNNQGLLINPSNRGGLIPGSPAPQSMREAASSNRHGHRSSRDLPPSPTITLSQYWDDEDEAKRIKGPDDSGGGWGATYHESVVQVHSAGSHHPPDITISHIYQPSQHRSKTPRRPTTSWASLSASSLAEVHKSVMERNSINGVLTPPPRVITMQDGQGHNVMTEFVTSSGMSWGVEEDQSMDRIKSKYSPLKPIQKKSGYSRQK